MIKPLSYFFNRMRNKMLFYSCVIGVLALSILSYYIPTFALSYQASATGYYTMAQYSVMALLMLLAWRLSPQSNKVKDHCWILFFAVIVRLLMFSVEPYTSNDVDRYLFDGRIVVEGLDPYSISHDAPELKLLRETWEPPAEHAKYVTLYPPLALAFFSLAAAAGITYAVAAWKLILLTASLLTLWLTAKVLQREKKLKHLALVALSPLLILETSVGLHLDALSTLAIIGAIYCWQRGWIIRAGLVIGLGTSIKLLPVMLLLPLTFTLQNFKQVFSLFISALMAVVSVYVLAIDFGLHPVGSIAIFFEKWRFAAPLFTVLDTILSGQEILFVMVGFSALVCSLVAYVCWCHRWTLANNKELLFGSLQLVIALPLIISPVIFPWYLMPLVPLMALYPNRYLIMWTLLMPLTYEVINQFICCQVWQPAQWPIWLIGLLQLSALLALGRYCYHALFKQRIGQTEKSAFV